MIPAKIVNSVIRGWRLVRVWKAQILILTLTLTLPLLTGQTHLLPLHFFYLVEVAELSEYVDCRLYLFKKIARDLL